MVGEGAVTPPSIRKDKKANLKQTLKLPKNFAKNKKTPVQRGGDREDRAGSRARNDPCLSIRPCS
jgi:hypothetical protein